VCVCMCVLSFHHYPSADIFPLAKQSNIVYVCVCCIACAPFCTAIRMVTVNLTYHWHGNDTVYCSQMLLAHIFTWLVVTITRINFIACFIHALVFLFKNADFNFVHRQVLDSFICVPVSAFVHNL